MVAVYYSDNASPYKVCRLPVPSARDEDFRAEVEKEKYPFPDTEVLFLENDEIVCQKFIKPAKR